MADVFFKLTAEEKDAVNALMKVLDAQKKVEGGYSNIKKAAKESDDAATAFGKSLDKGAESAAKTITSMVSITSAAGLAAAAVNLVAEGMAKTAQQANATKENIISMHEALAGQGQIHIAPEINAAIRKIAEATGEVSQHQVRGMATNILQDHGKKLSTKQIEETLDYAVRNKVAGLDSNQAGHNYATFQELDPKASAETIEKRAGQFGTLSKEKLGPDDVKMYREAIEGGQTHEFANLLLQTTHKSGESAKVISKIREEAGRTITEADKADKYKVSPENEAKIKELELQRDALTEKEHALDRAQGTKKHGKSYEKAQHAIAMDRNEIGDQIERLHKSGTLTDVEETERFRALDKVPMPQRQFAMLKEKNLMPHSLRTHGELFSADMQRLQANPLADKLEFTQDANARNYKTDEGREYRAAKELERAQVEKEERAAGTYEEKGAVKNKVQLLKDEADAVKQGNQVGGGKFGGFVEMTRQLGNQMWNSIPDDQAAVKPPRPPAEDGPQEVIVKADQSKVNRVVVARNGGN